MKKRLIYFLIILGIICAFFFNLQSNAITGMFIGNISIGLGSPIKNLSSEIYACENNYLAENFSVVKNWDGNLYTRISPSDMANPFSIIPMVVSERGNVPLQIISFLLLTKSTVGSHPENVSIQVLGTYVDSRIVSIKVVPINNPPVLLNVQNQSAQPDVAFDYQILASDIENGDQNSGNLSFNVTFISPNITLFNISKNGTISFTPNSGQSGEHLISVCVNDSGFNANNLSATICNQTNKALYDCENFTLTISTKPAPEVTLGAAPGGGGAEEMPRCYISLESLEAGTQLKLAQNQSCTLSFKTSEYNVTLKVFNKNMYIILLSFRENRAKKEEFVPLASFILGNETIKETQVVLQLGENTTTMLDNDQEKFLLLKFEAVYDNKAGIFIKKIKYTEIPSEKEVGERVAEFYSGLDERQKELLWLFILILIIMIIIILAIIIWLMVRERRLRELQRRVGKEVRGGWGSKKPQKKKEIAEED